jgi:hypothetical protein
MLTAHLPAWLDELTSLSNRCNPKQIGYSEGERRRRRVDLPAGTGAGQAALKWDRAVADGGIMQSSGLQSEQIYQVRGVADQQPRVKDSPEDAANRRISLIVQYLDQAPPDGKTDEKPQTAGDGAGAENPASEGKDSGIEKASAK